MRQAPTAPDTAGIVLPRPNLGPEPWSGAESGPGPAAIGWLLGGFLAVVILAWATRRLLRRRAARRAAGMLELFDPSLDPDTPPARRLIASSAAVRSALIAEFGPTWGSRTTEEVARDPAIVERLGPEVVEVLVAYLRRVDRAKFADEEPDDVDAILAEARDLTARLRASRPPAAGRPPRRSARGPSGA